MAHAQSPPAVSRTVNLPLSGTVNYTLHYAQKAEYGSRLGDWQTSSASASGNYANTSTRLPFVLNYSGGYTWTIAGPSYATGLFQHLLLSQGFVWKKWNASAADDVSYLPEAPTTGFSGIPGIGEPIGIPSPAPPSIQSVLTVSTHVLDNSVTGDLSRRLNYAYTISAGGSSRLMRYPDGNGINMNSESANAALTRRLGARNSLSGNYTFTEFSYPDTNFDFTTNAVMIDFRRAWSRKLSTDLAAGPEQTGSSGSALVPSALRAAVRATLTYNLRSVSANLNYNRATQGGAGYYIGAESDTITSTLSWELSRNLTIGVHGSYMRMAGLRNNGVTSSKFAGLQITRRLGPRFSVFANYTAMDQATSSGLPANTLSGLLQMASVGIGYSSREKHIGH
jgi:hypothetical protein